MKRRTVLKQLGLGVSGGMVFPHLLASCTKDNQGPEVKYDGTVAIIGAGAAGLFAADILRSKGVKVVIYEAASQVGGRIRSLRNQGDLEKILFPVTDETKQSPSTADFPIELGAELVFGSDSKWATEIKNLNVPLVDLSGVSSDRFVLENVAKTSDGWSGDVEFSGAQNFVNDLPNLSGGGTVGQAISSYSERVKTLLNSQIGNFYGASNETLGASGIAECLSLREHDKKIFTIRTNPMQDFLISRFSLVNDLIQLNTPISSINYGADIIELQDASGNTYEAGKVIVTVPVSILKSNAISFSPALPGSFSGSLAKIGMDHCIRVIIDFKKNFWGDDAGFLWGLKNAPYSLSTGVGRSEFFKTLSITINGPKAVELSALGPDMIGVILAELDLVYNGQATQFVRRELVENKIVAIIQDWGKEEFIKGGFSYPLASASIEDRANIGQSINDKLFFAGEATDVTGDAGTINGALASAERATTELVESILSA